MKKVVCLGELLIDLVSSEPGKGLEEAGSYIRAAGGAPANVAVGLAKQGLSVAFIGKVGCDPFGEYLKKTLTDYGVDTEYLYLDSEYRTTLGFAALRSDGAKDMCFYRHPGADMMLCADEVPEKLIRDVSLLHLGSLPLTAEPSRSASFHAIELAEKYSVPISFDPNYREGLWEDDDDARLYIGKVIEHSAIVKVSSEEWEFVTGIGDLEKGSLSLLNKGVSLVVVSLGKDGAYYHNGNVQGRVDACEVNALETLGAGDSFMASLLYGLLKSGSIANPRLLSDEELCAIIMRANVAGALATLKMGAMPSLPDSSDIDRFLASKGNNPGYQTE